MSSDSSTQVPQSGIYQIDPAHSMLEFVARHMMVSKVKGRFTDINGTIVVGGDRASHKVEVSALANSVDTRDEKRDAHLRSADFLDVDSYKELTFVSTGVESTDNLWILNGDLTIRGATRSIAINFEYTGEGKTPYGAEVIGFTGATQINRKDFGLEWNVALETGGVLVSDKIEINLDIEAIRQ